MTKKNGFVEIEPFCIRRTMANGVVMEFELTEMEVLEVYEYYEHHCDVQYANGNLSQRECDELLPLTEKQWMKAMDTIAYEKRRLQNEDGFDETEALDNALAWYIKNVLSKMPKRFFVIKLGKADEHAVVECIERVCCWACDMPSVHQAATYCREELRIEFDTVMSIEEVTVQDCTVYNDSEWLTFEFI